MKIKNLVVAALLTGAAGITANATIVTFEGLPLGNPGSDGSTQYGSTGTYYWNGSNSGGNFTTQNATFLNVYDTMFGSWEGFAYSNLTDSTTGGFGNQYSAIAGGGAGGSAKYGVGFQPYVGEWAINFDADENFGTGRGLFVTNTTYAGLDMANGSGFSKKFGGTSGKDADWFKLTINGWDGLTSKGAVEFYLADFRFNDNSQDYILNSWAFVNLSSLGTVDKLTFGLTSTDNGMFGMNTPAYFALDNVGAIPEPSTLILTSLGLGAWIFRRQRKTS